MRCVVPERWAPTTKKCLSPTAHDRRNGVGLRNAQLVLQADHVLAHDADHQEEEAVEKSHHDHQRSPARRHGAQDEPTHEHDEPALNLHSRPQASLANRHKCVTGKGQFVSGFFTLPEFLAIRNRANDFQTIEFAVKKIFGLNIASITRQVRVIDDYVAVWQVPA